MGRNLLIAVLWCLVAVPASAQSWTAPKTWSDGELVTAAMLNTHIRDNELVLRSGGISVASQAIGDLLCASSTTQFARLADVATGQVLKSGGVGACPSFGTINVAFLSDGSNVALLNAASQNLAGDLQIRSATNNAPLSVKPATNVSQLWLEQNNTADGWKVFVNSSDGSYNLYRRQSGSDTLASSLSAAGLLTVSGFGTQTFSAGGTGANAITVRNTAAGTANYGAANVVSDTVTAALRSFSSTYTTSGDQIASSSELLSDGSGGLSLVASNAAGVIREYTNGALRWGISAAGDRTFGASSHIADSSGTPTCSTNCFLIVNNTDYAPSFAGASSGHSTATITFGHTFFNAPTCTANFTNDQGAVFIKYVTTTTTTVTLTYSSNVTSETVGLLCRSL